MTAKPVNITQLQPNSRGASVSLWLWILKVKGPTGNLHNLISEVALITVRGATFGNQWEYYGLPLTFPLIWKNAAPNSYQDHLSIQNIQVFSWALDVPIISLNNALLKVWLLDLFQRSMTVVNPNLLLP